RNRPAPWEYFQPYNLADLYRSFSGPAPRGRQSPVAWKALLQRAGSPAAVSKHGRNRALEPGSAQPPAASRGPACLQSPGTRRGTESPSPPQARLSPLDIAYSAVPA